MIETIFSDKVRAVGLVGNRNSSKTSLGLQEIIDLKVVKYIISWEKEGKILHENCFDDKEKEAVLYTLINKKGISSESITIKEGIKKYVFGVEESLKDYLVEKEIIILENKEDLLDLKIKDAIIYIDEFADVYDVSLKSKQGERIRRFFNRLNHLNDWVLVSTAQEKFWNSFICGLIKDYVVKEIEYNSLVNGTDLKTKVKGIGGYSDYRLECPNDTYYIVGKDVTIKGTFEYNKNLDSKKNNINPFRKVEENLDKFIGKNVEINSEI